MNFFKILFYLFNVGIYNPLVSHYEAVVGKYKFF